MISQTEIRDFNNRNSNSVGGRIFWRRPTYRSHSFAQNDRKRLVTVDCTHFLISGEKFPHRYRRAGDSHRHAAQQNTGGDPHKNQSSASHRELLCLPSSSLPSLFFFFFYCWLLSRSLPVALFTWLHSLHVGAARVLSLHTRAATAVAVAFLLLSSEHQPEEQVRRLFSRVSVAIDRSPSKHWASISFAASFYVRLHVDDEREARRCVVPTIGRPLPSGFLVTSVRGGAESVDPERIYTL